MFSELPQRTLPAHTSAHRSRRVYSDFEIDLIVIEAGLRLKVLPLQLAIARGNAIAMSPEVRAARRREFLQLCRGAPVPLVDVGLFADAVCRHPEVASTLSFTPRSLALTLHQPSVIDPEST